MAYRSSRVRWLGAAMLLLVGGAVVNVLVAWGCVIASEPSFQMRPIWGQWITRDPLMQREGWRLSDVFARESRGLTEATLVHARSPWSQEENAARQMNLGVYWLAGWPCRALACAAFDRSAVVGGFRLSQSTPNPPAISASDESRPLPCLPRWPGFAINTAFYTGVLACGFVGPSCAKWLRSRRRPGACRKCGYDLKGNVSGVCPECGATA